MASILGHVLVVTNRPKQRSVNVLRVLGALEICSNPVRSLSIDDDGALPLALSTNAQGIVAPCRVQIEDTQLGDLVAPKSRLKANRENGSISQTHQRVR